LLADGLVLGAYFTWGDTLLQLLAFLLLMWLLKKFAWKRVVEVMKEREEYIAGQIEAAEKAKQEANRLLEQQRELIRQSREESHQFIENAKRQGEAQREEIIRLAREEAERMKEAAKMEIELEREKAMAALREQVATLSVRIASRVIGRELNEKDQEAFIQQFLEKAGVER